MVAIELIKKIFVFRKLNHATFFLEKTIFQKLIFEQKTLFIYKNYTDLYHNF